MKDSFIDFKELGYFIQHAHEYARRIEELLKKWKEEDEEKEQERLQKI